VLTVGAPVWRRDPDGGPFREFEVPAWEPGVLLSADRYDADPIAVLELLRELHHDPARRPRVVSGSASGLCAVRDADAGRSTAE